MSAYGQEFKWPNQSLHFQQFLVKSMPKKMIGIRFKPLRGVVPFNCLQIGSYVFGSGNQPVELPEFPVKQRGDYTGRKQHGGLLLPKRGNTAIKTNICRLIQRRFPTKRWQRMWKSYLYVSNRNYSQDRGLGFGNHSKPVPTVSMICQKWIINVINVHSPVYAYVSGQWPT